MDPVKAQIEEVVRDLAELERPSASEGEREAARRVAARLEALGADVRIEHERVHGTYWWPIGLMAGAGVLGGFAARRGRRGVGAILGLGGAVGIWDDLTGGRKWLSRHVLPQSPMDNVVGEVGDPEAAQTIVFVAHHDAAHTSFIFNPETVPRFARAFPRLFERATRWPPLMGLVFGGPSAVAVGSLLGLRRLTALGTALSLGSAGVMAEIGSRGVVPGANDNLTGVAVLVALAAVLRERPVEGVRVLLVSNGAEESNQDGIQAFGRRHFVALPPDLTLFVSLDTVGSPELVLIESEGFLRQFDYPDDVKELVSGAAAEAGVHLRRGLRMSFATDGLIPLRAGYPTASVGSVTEYRVPANYHWPTDVPDNVIWESVADCVRLCESLVRRVAGQAASSRPPAPAARRSPRSRRARMRPGPPPAPRSGR